MSQNGKFLAVCERAAHAVCSIYQLLDGGEIDKSKLRPKKVLPDPEVARSWKAKEFLGVVFDLKNEKQILYTLNGEPDWCIIVWNWDKLSELKKINLNYDDKQLLGNWQMTNSKDETTNVYICVTGPNCYRYYQI